MCKTLVFALIQFALVTVIPVNSWTAEFLTQTQALQCKPSDQQQDYTFVHGRQAGSFTTLGHVEDMDVCVLLCCELDTCQAAFLEDKSCFSVRCQSKDHCATAPAVGKGKGQVSVAFITRLVDLSKDQTVKEVKPKSTETKSSSAINAPKPGPIKIKPALAKSSNELPVKSQKLDDKKPVTEQQAVKPVQPQTNETLPQLQAIQADKQSQEVRIQTDKKKEVKKIQYSLISAAVATCLVAFILTGIALVAVKIRKQREEGDSEEKMKLAEEGG